MLAQILITNDDIQYAERMILPEGKKFDKERIEFIKDLSTFDLQAVPGSGKTTALLAKLIILDKYLPFNDGSGLLVISHTNAAINEIGIAKYCRHLFSYPNYIGTIQGFVDEFLAIPYFIQIAKKQPNSIDNEIFLSNFHSSYPRNYKSGLEKKYGDKLNSFILQVGALSNRDYIFSLLDDQEIIIPKCGKDTETYKKLKEFKIQQLNSGNLSFNDAYFLASKYLEKYPKIKSLINTRFSGVFVDEMQDMDTHQYKLLETLFFDSNNKKIIYQRIGDKNQAIFNGETKNDLVWIDRTYVKNINGSHRLNKNIAKVVEPFALYPIQIIGNCQNDDGSVVDIKPIVIVYDDYSKTKIINKFAQIIKKLEKSGSLPKLSKNHNSYHAISWNKGWKTEKDASDENKLRLVDFFPQYKSISLIPHTEFATFEDHLLNCNLSVKNFKLISDNIYSGLLKVLRLEKIKTDDDKYYTKYSLSEKLKNIEKMEDFNSRLYNWCLLVAQGNTAKALIEIRTYLTVLISYFDATLSNVSSAFINNSVQKVTKNLINTSQDQKKLNNIKIDGIRISIGTVHSVKGMTHTATLYLESYFKSDGKGVNAKSYESQRLIDQFKGNKIDASLKKNGRHSAKMIYVGFSRPTHLLCFAVHKNRFSKDNFLDLWEIDQSLIQNASEI